MAEDILSDSPRNFAATSQINYKNSYKRRLMDRTIMHDITNQNFQGDVGRGKGTTVRVYVPGTVQIHETRPGGGIQYQRVTDTFEDYSVNREAYWALRFRPEDLNYMPWDPRSEYFTNATDQLARHIEKKFGAFAIANIPAFNKGNAAGIKYHGFDMGAPGDGNACTLYKTQAQCDAATSVQHRDVAADFIVKGANMLRENEGLSGGHVIAVIPSPVKHHLQTSELKYEGVMGRNTVLGDRGDAKFLGTMDDTITVIQNNIMLPVHKNTTNGHNIYPVLFLMKDAFTYIDDTVFRDDDLDDIAEWDKFYRAKQIYDFAMVYPQMAGLGLVELAQPTYVAG